MRLSRREIAMAAMLAGAALAGGEAEAAPPSNRTEHGPRPSPDTSYFTKVKGGEYIAMVIYPGMTALDLIGPHYFFSTMRGAKVHLVAPTMAPVTCGAGVVLSPTATYADVPKEPDILFVPGAGFPTLDAMKNDQLIDFLADRGAGARYVTAVCTGPLLLGAAGLLKGYRATANWGIRDKVLPALGAIPVDARYVVDRNRITGGGVTAGIDFGLHIATLLRGPDNARICQLLAEYDPAPPFDSGSPHTAWPESVALVRNMIAGFSDDLVKVGQDRIRKT
jgi:putative intracellular protease/amidase